MNWLKIAKIATQGGGWATMLAALITLALKAAGVNVEESAVLPLIVAALGLIQGASFIPAVDKSVPVMTNLHNQTIDALFHLDKTLVGDEVSKAVGVLWAAARAVPKPEVK